MSTTTRHAGARHPADVAELEATVRHLAAIDRPSASPGEREAAEWIAARLRELGYEPRVEEERVHGGYWWPLGLLAALGGLAGIAALRGRRVLGALGGAFAAFAMGDDLDHRSRWFRRHTLSTRPSWNVTVEAGDPTAERTVVLVAHHDAAHSGLIFNPAIPSAIARRFPGLLERSNVSPPLLWLVFGGPLLVALGSLLRRRGPVRAGTALSLGSAATMIDIGLRPAVPGANDNLSGVAAILGVARALRERPLQGVRVLLVSAGSEESNSEGFQAWGRRHFPSLPRGSTRVICVDTVGSPRLTAPESEGMLVPHGYDPGLKDLASTCAAELGIDLGRGLRFSFATDAQIALHAGYRAMMLGSVNELKAPANYHWPTDTAENVVYERVADGVVLCDALVRAIAAGRG